MDAAALQAWLSILSGALIAGLGVFLFSANPRKDWNRLFALLAAFWGAQIMANNVVLVTDNVSLARFAGELGLAFVIPLPFFVVMFASTFPRPQGRYWGLVLLAPAAATLILLFAAPELLLRGVQPHPTSGGLTMRWGPALPYLVVAPLFAAFFYALFVMMRRLDDASPAIERRQVTFVLAAFAAYVAYSVPWNLFLFGEAALGLSDAASADRAEAIVIALVMLVGLGLLAVLAIRARRERLVLASIAAPGVAGIVTAAAFAATGQRIDLLGLVRLGSVGLIVYGVARYQLFDIDLRVKQVATTLAAALVALALAAAAWAIVRSVGVTPAMRGVVVAAAGLVALIPLLGIARSVADRVAPRVSREGDHLYLRKLEVYRAAVESRTDEPTLAELREKLSLSERDHDLVVNMALARAESSIAPDLRPGGIVFGKYAIDSVLGEGGYGRVFLARDRILQRAVVIKELQARWRGNASVVKTFLREAQIAGRLNHPNIVSVLEVERHGEDHYIVMEHMAGGSLDERLRGGSLPPEEAVRVARAVLSALDAAHAQGVVHRDVKPANILLGSHGEVKLTDFGIAQMSADDPQRTISGLTLAGPHAGTLQYMSPEQARGRPLDPRSDLYAVGALLYRMITGRPHVDLSGLDEFNARAAVAEARTPSPPAGALGAVAARALAPDPAGRYQTAREFLDALRLNPLVEQG